MLLKKYIIEGFYRIQGIDIQSIIYKCFKNRLMIERKRIDEVSTNNNKIKFRYFVRKEKYFKTDNDIKIENNASEAELAFMYLLLSEK